MRFVIIASLITPFASACGGHDHGPEGFATYQACFDDHKIEEMQPTNDAIVICCLEHPIDGHTEVCGATAADCMTYLAASLAATSATSAEVTAACTDYITQKGM